MGDENKREELKQKWQRNLRIDTASERSSSDGCEMLLSVNVECGKAVIDRLEEMEDALAWRVAHEIQRICRERSGQTDLYTAIATDADWQTATRWLDFILYCQQKAERMLTANELHQIGRDD